MDDYHGLHRCDYEEKVEEVEYPMIPCEDRVPLGTFVRKDFGKDHGGWFSGEIADYSSGVRFYHIIYSDGDEEDLTPAQLFQQTTIVKCSLTDTELQRLKTKALQKEAPTAAPPTLAATGSDQPLRTAREGKSTDQEPRRSSRERKSTVIHVKGGHTIKKINNYKLTGHTYAYGVVDDDRMDVDAPPRRRNNSKQQTKKKPKQPSKKTTQRHVMRDWVQVNVANQAYARHDFLHRHLHVLEPFITDKVRQRLSSPATVAATRTTKNNFTKNKDGTDASLVSLLEKHQPPAGITATLRDYQMEGLQWMATMHAKNAGMILGDEMGLGKTLQTIALIKHINAPGPSLVVCPLSVLYSWCDEIAKWAPSLKYLRFHGSETTSLAKEYNSNNTLEEYDIIVTTYEMIKANGLKFLWSRQHFALLVLDEGHKIKCRETQIHQAVCQIHAQNRLILTGTPLANNLVELHSLLQFLYPDVFTTDEPFREAFDLTLQQVDDVKLGQAYSLLNAFMIRRLKIHVEQKLPPKLETKVLCPLSNSQIAMYKALLLKDMSLLASAATADNNSSDSNGEVAPASSKVLNNLLMQLRKCCLHPFLFSDYYLDDDDDQDDAQVLRDMVGASGKLAVLDELLRSLYRKGHRVVIFSQFTRMLDILEDYGRLRNWQIARLDGGTSRARRNYVVQRFNHADSKQFALIMSTRSGGMGLNLQTADTVILFDSDWNPQPDLQAMARVHRIGQTKKVHVYRLVTDGTVEQRMVERAEKKLYLDRMVTRDGAKDESPARNDQDDDDNSPDEAGGRILQALRFGCNAVFGQGGSKKQALPTPEEIETITDRSRTEAYSCGNLKGGAESSTDNFDATKDFSSTMNFSGIDFRKIREEHDTKKVQRLSARDMANILQKRQRKSRIKMVAGAGTGYGKSSVPVLAANDYGFEGEKSVFDRELKSRNPINTSTKNKASKHTFENVDFCQVCYDGGHLVMCPRCPNSLHLTQQCSGLTNPNHFQCCTQHHCAVCGKTPTAAGGMLFTCASCCPDAFCEDHLPEGARFLEDGSPRHEDLGYTLANGCFIYCNQQCEDFATKEFGWKPPIEGDRSACPDSLGVASCFGGEVDEIVEEDPKEALIVSGKRRRNKIDYSYPKSDSPKTKPKQQRPTLPHPPAGSENMHRQANRQTFLGPSLTKFQKPNSGLWYPPFVAANVQPPTSWREGSAQVNVSELSSAANFPSDAKSLQQQSSNTATVAPFATQNAQVNNDVTILDNEDANSEIEGLGSHAAPPAPGAVGTSSEIECLGTGFNGILNASIGSNTCLN